MDVVTKKDVFNVKLCSSLFSRIMGFMFRSFNDYDGLLFDLHGSKSYSLHMLFVFLPLDIVYLDSEFKVLRMLKGVKPFVPFIPGFKCSYILELKDCRNLKVGDRVVVVE